MRTLLVLIVGITLGFFVHAIFFPDIFINKVSFTASPFTNQGKNQTGAEDTEFLTHVEYNNGQFTPSVVKIKKSFYIQITNRSREERMWLTSNNPLLSTTREYAESESVKARLDEAGTFTVKNRVSSAELVVIVK